MTGPCCPSSRQRYPGGGDGACKGVWKSPAAVLPHCPLTSPSCLHNSLRCGMRARKRARGTSLRRDAEAGFCGWHAQQAGIRGMRPLNPAHGFHLSEPKNMPNQDRGGLGLRAGLVACVLLHTLTLPLTLTTLASQRRLATSLQTSEAHFPETRSRHGRRLQEVWLLPPPAPSPRRDSTTHGCWPVAAARYLPVPAGCLDVRVTLPNPVDAAGWRRWRHAGAPAQPERGELPLLAMLHAPYNCCWGQPGGWDAPRAASPVQPRPACTYGSGA